MPRPEKTNPFGKTCEPWIARNFAGIFFRHSVRELLASRSENAQAEFERQLGAFAPTYVRGDYVPVIADAYWQMLDIVNAAQPELPLQKSHGHKPNVRVRVQWFNEATNAWEVL